MRDVQWSALVDDHQQGDRAVWEMKEAQAPSVMYPAGCVWA